MIERSGLEREAEQEILDALRKLDLYAVHMNTTIDGFPDILVAGNRIILVEMKFDRSGGRVKLKDIMQASQPVFARAMLSAGFDDIYLCAYNGESYTLYLVAELLLNTMNDKCLSSLPVIKSNNTPEGIAAWIARRSCNV